MKRICYYREFTDDKTLPSIRENISSTPISNKQKVLRYLKSFEPQAVAPGSSQDIFTHEKIVGNLSCYTDGRYVWLSNEIYYLERYNLILDNEFLEFIDHADMLQNLKNKLKSKYKEKKY